MFLNSRGARHGMCKVSAEVLEILNLVFDYTKKCKRWGLAGSNTER